TLVVLRLVGAILMLAGLGLGLILGIMDKPFLIPHGLVLAILGLFYLWGYVAVTDPDTDTGYRTALAVGFCGAITLLVAFCWWVVNQLFYTLGWREMKLEFLVPQGMLLMGLGLLYVGVAVGLCSDNRYIILTRRELASFFFSPMAYIVLVGTTVVGWIQYDDLVAALMEARFTVIEPIILHFAWGLFPVIAVIFIVPVLTMRLLSEEKRSGTLEVLLTAPVDEFAVVMSKFFAALITFVVLCLPWGVFLIGLRVVGGKPFDYQAMLSFFIALVVSGSGFIAMGLFFSSLTRNQIASAVLTFAGMVLYTLFHMLKN